MRVGGHIGQFMCYLNRSLSRVIDTAIAPLLTENRQWRYFWSMKEMVVDRPVTRREIWESIVSIAGASNSALSRSQAELYEAYLRTVEVTGDPSLWYPHTLSEAAAMQAPDIVAAKAAGSGVASQTAPMRNFEEQRGGVVSTDA